ncbi:MAG TPA: hypothetical protein DFS52_22995, partial [Myxococcales bacterium]|nr:hypothetical protein [Myxococcales bacterium]
AAESTVATVATVAAVAAESTIAPESVVAAEPAPDDTPTADETAAEESADGESGETAQGLARAALEAEGTERTRLATCVVWALLHEGQMALAHEIAACVEQHERPGEPGPGSALIRALVLGCHVRSSDDAVAMDFVEALQQVVVPVGDDEDSAAVRALCAAMAMRPALLAGGTGAIAFLQALPLQGSSLSDLRAAIGDYLKLGLELNPTVLRGVREQASWQAQIVALQEGCAAYLDRAKSQTIRYHAATGVLRHLVEKRSKLRAVLEPMLEGRVAEHETVFRLGTELSDERALQRLITETDEQLRGRSSRAKAIEGPALRGLHKSLREVLSYPIQWAELVAASSTRAQDPVLKRAEPLRGQIVAELRAVRRSLEGMCPDNLASRAARAVLLRALADLEALFDPDAVLTAVPSPERLVWADLLRVPGLRLDGRAQPEGAPDVRLERVLPSLREG